MQVIKQIGVLSLAKILAVSGLLVGLIVSVPMGLFMMLMGALGGAAASGEEASSAGGMVAGGIGGGLFVMVAIPIFYGLVINLVFSIAGGLEVRIEGKI